VFTWAIPFVEIGDAAIPSPNVIGIVGADGNFLERASCNYETLLQCKEGFAIESLAVSIALLGHYQRVTAWHNSRLIGGIEQFDTRLRNMKTTLQYLVCGLVLTSSASAAEWTQWNSAVGGNNHFYSVTGSASSWFDARDEAQTAGGYLTSIGSFEELNFIRTTFGRTELFWTGLSSVNNPGTFGWENGEPITFTYFGAHQPNVNQLSAVVINSPVSRGAFTFNRGHFMNMALNTELRGIIEREDDPNAPSPNDPPTERVPDGGTTVLLLGAALLATGAWRTVRR
jgi:hypothetical protein